MFIKKYVGQTVITNNVRRVVDLNYGVQWLVIGNSGD